MCGFLSSFAHLIGKMIKVEFGFLAFLRTAGLLRCNTHFGDKNACMFALLLAGWCSCAVLHLMVFFVAPH